MSVLSELQLKDLSVDQTIKVKTAYLNQLNLKLAMKKKADEEKTKPVEIKANHLSFVTAFPLNRFISDTFNILEQGRQYQDNWHIDAISEVLTACTTGQCKRILISLPRRCMKSTLVSVMWFAWSWTFLPHTRWLYASFSEKFAYRDSNNCRKLIMSAYYQQKFGDIFKISKLENKAAKFANNKGGFRACFGVGKGTGDGGDFVGVDDPHQIDESGSEKIVEKTVQWFFETYSNNVTNPQTAVKFVMQQRVDEDDLTGAIVARELGYEYLCLPMNFEDDHPHKNSVSKPLRLGTVSVMEVSNDKTKTLKVGEEKLFVDPRDIQAPFFENKWYQKWYQESYASRGLKSEGEGQLLWMNHFPPKEIADIQKNLGSFGISAQLQQRPIKRGGNFFNSDDFLVSKKAVSRETFDYNNKIYCRYWDKAGTEDGGHWTVGLLLARTLKMPYMFYIVHVIRVQYSYNKRMELMIQTAEDDTKNYVESKTGCSLSIGIEGEKNSSAKDVSALERQALIGYDVFIEYPKMEKAERAKVPKKMADQDQMKMLEGSWNNEFLRELEKFRPEKKRQRDDQIDALSGATRKLIFGVVTQRFSASGAN